MLKKPRMLQIQGGKGEAVLRPRTLANPADGGTASHGFPEG